MTHQKLKNPDKQARLAQELRSNLMKRKAQNRARQSTKTPESKA